MDQARPPDPDPKPPIRRPPPGACDCHAHVFGPYEDFPLAPGRGYTPPEASLESYLAMLDMLGLRHGIIVQPSVYGIDNRATLAALQGGAGRLRGVAVLDGQASRGELEAMHEAGFRGIRFNLGNIGGVTEDLLEIMAERIRPLGWHIQINSNAEQLAQLATRLLALNTDLVIDHVGGINPEQGLAQPGFQALLGMVKDNRAWVKLSSPYGMSHQEFPFADITPFARELVLANPERMLWATNWPHPNAEGPLKPEDAGLLELLEHWAPDEETRNRILVDNPQRLYWGS